MKEKIQNLKTKITEFVSKSKDWANKALVKIDEVFSKTLAVSKYAVIIFNLAMIVFFMLTAGVNPESFFGKVFTVINWVLLAATVIAGLFAGTYNILPTMVEALGKALGGALYALAGGLSIAVFNAGGFVSFFVGLFQYAAWAMVFIACLFGVVIVPAPLAWFYIWKDNREMSQLKEHAITRDKVNAKIFFINYSSSFSS